MTETPCGIATQEITEAAARRIYVAAVIAAQIDCDVAVAAARTAFDTAIAAADRAYDRAIEVAGI